jgi:hypothetical protein
VDVWWPGTDGSIESATKVEGDGEWRRSRVGGDGSTIPAGALAGLSRVDEHLQVFWIAPDGAVRSGYWIDGAEAYTRAEVAPLGSAEIRGGIAAVSRQSGLMEVWWIGPGGSVEGAWWQISAPKTWNRYQVAPAGSTATTSRLAAIWRNPGHMEVIWIGADSSVRGAYWYDERGVWQTYELAPPGAAAGRSGVAAACRHADHMQVAWIGELGSVETASWEGGGPWTMLQIARNGAAGATASIAAAARDADHLDVWWTGADATVSTATWQAGTWREQLFPTPGDVSPVGGIAGVTPFAECLHVWWVDASGEVHGSRWLDEPIDVVVRYRGLICFGETDWDRGTNSDEPYLVMSVLPANGLTTTIRSQVYEDVDSGDNRADLVEIYRGAAHGLQLGMVLMENDDGDPNAVRDDVEGAVKTASAAITAAVTAGGGPVAGLAVGVALGAAGPALSKAINDALDTGDDELGTQSRFYDRKELTALASAGFQHFRDTEYKFQSALFTGDGSSYKACFDVIPV